MVGLEAPVNRARLAPDEREAINAIFAMYSLLKGYDGQFKRLFGRAEIEQDYIDIILTVQSAIDKILDTVPLSQLKSIKAAMAISEIHLGVKSAGKRPDDMWVIPYQDLADLAEYATKTNCMACDQMHKPCRLRDILRDLPIEGVEKLVVGCWGD